MARQPFLPTYAGTPLSIASFMIEQMPKLAQIVGRITVNWSGVDLQMSLLLGSLVGIENEAAVAVFVSLKNHRAQRDALRAAAETTIGPDLRRGFDALIRIHGRLDKQRNDVVHGIWGTAEKTPDGLIWSSLQDYANMIIRDYHNFRTGYIPPKPIDRSHEITKDCYVVRYQDLEELNSSIVLLAEATGNFHAHLRYMSEVAGVNALKAFLANPLVAAELPIDQRT
jgi:hypothetical protein